MAVSAALHAAALAAMLLWPRHPGPPGAPQDPGFEMMYDTGARAPDAVPAPGPTVQAPNGAVMAPAQAGEATPQEPNVNLFTAEEQPMPPAPPPPDYAPMQALPPPPPPRPSRSRAAAAARGTGVRHNPFGSPSGTVADSRNTQAPGAEAATGTTLSMGAFAHGGQAMDATAHISMPGAHGDYDDILFEYAVRHLSYPENAASNDESGTVIIRVRIARDGTVTDVKLLKSSVYRVLDLNTMDVYRNKKMPPLPDDITGATHDFTLAVEYDLIINYR
ncbi:MAG: energy transducer TonB [Rhodospirillales bacterium]